MTWPGEAVTIMKLVVTDAIRREVQIIHSQILINKNVIKFYFMIFAIMNLS